jgi:hypothetical protein
MRLPEMTAALLLAFVAPAQDLSPEMELWVRIKLHMQEELAHLPNYTCLETLTRFEKVPRPGVRPRLEPLDTVRLEVVYTDGREWYGSPGDRILSLDNPRSFVGSGMIGTGAFAITLHNVIVGSTTSYRGEENLGGRKAVRFDFRMLGTPLEVTLREGIGNVGEEGSIWVDPQSLDLIRIESRAINIPSYLPLDESSTVVNYAHTRIGDLVSLLPQQADMHMLQTKGIEDYDRIEFTHCRAFSAQSEIRFDAAPPDHVEQAAPIRHAIEAAPPFLPILMQLATPVTEKDAVGTLIAATTSGDVVRKGEVVIPSGSVVRGRIRRLERYQVDSGSDEFALGLEFTEIEVSGEPLRFYADFVKFPKLDKHSPIRPNLSEPVLVRTGSGVQARTQMITLPELPGVASFFVHGKTFTLPNGFQMEWRTRALIRGLDR